MSLAGAWVALLLVLAVMRPRGMDLHEAKRLVPDIVRLLRALMTDPEVPAVAKRRLGFLLAYLASPLDLVPDFLPVLGYADDVIVIGLVLGNVVKRAGPEAITRNWPGTDIGLAVVTKLARLPPPT